MARVEWDDGSLSWIPTRLLSRAVRDRSIGTLLTERAFGGHDDFVRNYTHRKLLIPVDDTLYSLAASRTQLLPHQFKPLVRFLESVHRRFLIADEVGLGKTIEAGIIISELRARKTLGGVLVICPNHLRDKWRFELLSRFEEEFEMITTRKDWLHLSDRFENESTEGLRCIIGHKTLASSRLLLRAEQGVPAFDLIVVDEAHYARNTATQFRQILGELADAANQLLLLTATPLQTQVENLLSLLRLIDEPAFRSKELFLERLATNVHLVRAEAALRSSTWGGRPPPPACKSAGQELAKLSDHRARMFGLNLDGRLSSIRDRLKSLEGEEAPDISDLSAVAEDLKRLNLLSPYITRTRKSEVQQSCERRVRSVRPSLTPEERSFYELTVKWIRERIEDRHGPDAVAFLSREPERRLASSFHGFWKHLELKGRANDTLLGNPPTALADAYQAIRRTDTKYARLRSILRRLAKEDPEAKILIFATFRASITYLRGRLNGDGVQYEWIHGGVEMDPSDPERNERGRRIDRFLNDPDVRVLISSNVGGEGLDLQAASVVVNYDLPWNPAVVEQRIGRVDRFGQLRSTIHVVNIILPETVEDLIYTRLIERLHLFKSTIGDLAQVLGPMVRRLSTDFLSQELTPEEKQKKLSEEVWRGENDLAHRKELLKREGEFIAYDQDFADQLRGYEHSGQTLRPDEVAKVCIGVIDQYFPVSFLRKTSTEETRDAPKGQVFELFIDFQLRHALVSFLKETGSTVLRRFIARVPEGSPRLVTFDGRLAEQTPALMLLTTRHPFVRALIEYGQKDGLFHPVSSVELAGGSRTSAHSGLLTLCSAELRFGIQQRRYLVPSFMMESGHLPVDAARRVLREALDNGRPLPGHAVPESNLLARLYEEGKRKVEEHLTSLASRIEELEDSRIRPRVAEAEARYDRRITNAAIRKAEADFQQPRDEKRIKAIDRYLKQLQRDKKRKVAELSQRPEVELNVTPVGASWIEMT